MDLKEFEQEQVNKTVEELAGNSAGIMRELQE